MDKRLEFPAVDQTGNLFSEVLRWDRPMTKQASRDLHPEIAKFVDSLKPSDDCVYILVNALGAGEYYGCNQNGDYFEESELDPAQWRDLPVTSMMTGYRSYYEANWFRNHKNQDPTQGWGKVVCAVYNRDMHRVELIVRIDKALAEKFGHSDVYAKLQAGERVATSMGTRVPYDVCSICGNKSKTKKDYCVHALTQMRDILPDGRQVCVKNPKCRFFDISVVVIGADSISFAMSKVASAAPPVRLSVDLADEEPLVDRMRRLMKEASTKRADIDKDVPALSSAVMPELTDGEEDLPKRILHMLSSAPDLGHALSGAAATGIVLKPREFQRVILVRLGMPGMADSCDACGREIDPCAGAADNSIALPTAPQGIDDIVRALMPFLQQRSAFTAPLTARISITKVASYRARQIDRTDPLLRKIAAAYTGYRYQVLEKIANIVASTTVRDVRLLAAVTGDSLGDALSSSYRVKQAAPDAARMALLGAIPVAYLYGAHRGSQQAAAAGAGPSQERFLSRHPIVTLSVLAGLARLGYHAHKSGQLSALLASAAKHLTPAQEVEAAHAHPHR